MKIGLLGDTHGNHTWIREAVRAFHIAGITTVIQVGDLGVSENPLDTVRWDTTNGYLKDRGITFLVAPGNHEDYDVIDALTPQEDGWLPYRSNILLAPRGHRTTMGGRTFVWLGGAGSVDRTLRTQGRTVSAQLRYWWPQEALTDDDVQAATAGGHADVMIAHDAPIGAPTLEAHLERTKHHWNPRDRDYAHQCRATFTRAVAAIQPKLLIHGHYHLGIDDHWGPPGHPNSTRVLGLGMDGDRLFGSGTLDTKGPSAAHRAT